MVTYPLKDAIPSEIWDLMAMDMKEAKRQTEELVGFKSPDLVGKIAPEIGPPTIYGMPTVQQDHIDEHSTFQMQVPFPALVSRKDFTIQHLIKRGK